MRQLVSVRVTDMSQLRCANINSRHPPVSQLSQPPFSGGGFAQRSHAFLGYGYLDEEFDSWRVNLEFRSMFLFVRVRERRFTGFFATNEPVRLDGSPKITRAEPWRFFRPANPRLHRL